jgi:alkanesulfonate monooxygenase SsuD/methylene tetrahydromethanopterin reductase-like flavin-dependent oxidoreductase (luciferase family)
MKFGAALPACVEGLGYPLGFVSPDVLARIAEHAEAAGFHAVMANDHISTPNNVRRAYDRPPDFYEPLITLAYCAARTERIRLMTGAVALPIREPVVVAKQATTLDQFCGGRLILGVAPGAHPEEFEATRPALRRASRAIPRLAEGRARLRRYAEQAGRDPDTISVATQFVVCLGRTQAEAEERFRASPSTRSGRRWASPVWHSRTSSVPT